MFLQKPRGNWSWARPPAPQLAEGLRSYPEAISLAKTCPFLLHCKVASALSPKSEAPCHRHLFRELPMRFSVPRRSGIVHLPGFIPQQRKRTPTELIQHRNAIKGPIWLIQRIPTGNHTISIETFSGAGNRAMSCHDGCFRFTGNHSPNQLAQSNVHPTRPSVSRMFLVELGFLDCRLESATPQIMYKMLLVRGRRPRASLPRDGPPPLSRSILTHDMAKAFITIRCRSRDGNTQKPITCQGPTESE